MAKDKEIEIVSMQLSGRNIVDCSEMFRQRCKLLTGSEDFRTLDLGAKLPDKFLQLDGPQPTLAELTVLANKLKVQLRITHIELMPITEDKPEGVK